MTDAQRQMLNHADPTLQAVNAGTLLFNASGKMGKEWFLDPVNGDDANDGLSSVSAFKTLAVAYAALTANKNEILYILGGASSLTIASGTTGFTWAKSYTHCIGLCAGGPYGRVRMGHSGSLHIVTLFTLNAAGCIFKNIHWQLGNGHAENLNCVLLSATASYNYFEGCHFDAPLDAAEGAATFTALYLTALARSNTFRDCWFGDWTAAPSSATGALVRFLGTNAGTQFIGCTFIINTSSASFVAVISAANMGDNAAAYASFQDCDFMSLATAVNSVFTPPTTGKIAIMGCRAVGVTEWDTDASNYLLISCGAAEEANGQGGIGVVQGS